MNIPITFIGGRLHGRATVVDSDVEESVRQLTGDIDPSFYSKRIWRIELSGLGNFRDQVFFVLSTLEESEAAGLVSEVSKSYAVPVMA